jgi:hypothetical protein
MSRSNVVRRRGPWQLVGWRAVELSRVREWSRRNERRRLANHKWNTAGRTGRQRPESPGLGARTQDQDEPAEPEPHPSSTGVHCDHPRHCVVDRGLLPMMRDSAGLWDDELQP